MNFKDNSPEYYDPATNTTRRQNIGQEANSATVAHLHPDHSDGVPREEVVKVHDRPTEEKWQGDHQTTHAKNTRDPKGVVGKPQAERE